MISGVKCRTRRALDFRTHIAASGLTRGFVCLRVGMKLKTLYKSVVEYAVLSCCTRQTYADTRSQVYGLTNIYVRMRVVVHSLATYGANTTRSPVPLLSVRRLRHVHSFSNVSQAL